MTDILSIIRDNFPGKYDYLRLGQVRLADRKINVVFLVPEDVYNFRLTNADISNIQAATASAIGEGYKVNCHFEKIVLTEESIRSALAEYLTKYFPLVAANIDFSRAKVDLDKGTIDFTVQENIRDYMQKNDFDRQLSGYFDRKYALSISCSFTVVEDGDISLTGTSPSASGRYGKSVTVTDKVLLAGKMGDLADPAVHIATLKGEGENVVCCGKITRISFKERDESKKIEGRRFFKRYYYFGLSDTTGQVYVLFNTDDEYGSLVQGAEVVCKGRVNLREDGTLGMFVKSIALCKVPFDTIAEQTRPLDAPENYAVLFPKEYTEVSYDQIGFDFLEDTHKKRVNTSAAGVTIAVRALKAERVTVPYEVALCAIEKGKITEYIHTYLKVAFSEDSEIAEFANRMGYSSPRLATVVPDLIKFTSGKLLIGSNPAGALEMLNAVAKPLRYLFANDLHVLQLPSAKAGSTALDEAIELANAFISE